MSIHACMPVLELLAISVVQLKQMPFCPPPLLLLPKMASHIFFFFFFKCCHVFSTHHPYKRASVSSVPNNQTVRFSHEVFVVGILVKV